MTKEIENTVSALIDAAGVVMAVVLVGPTKRDDWECDEWRVTFTRGAVSESFEYFTGIGHRVDTPETRMARVWLKHCNRKSIAWVNGVEKKMQPKAPHVAGVLYSLIMDSSASGQSFAHWCDEFGYDADSRKSLATYETCQRNADKLALIFNEDARQALADALQDY